MEENIIYEPVHYIDLDILNNDNKELYFSRDEYIEEFNRCFYENIEAYLIENLNKKGFSFKNKEEFYEFCKSRVSRLDTNGIYHDFYLDFINLENRGILIGKYYNRSITEFDHSEFALTLNDL